MADAAAFRLEGTFAGLEDLEKREILTHAQVRAVTQQRHKHELALNRRGPSRDDFRRAIAYEKKLDELRVQRKRILGLRKVSQGDSSIRTRVTSLYRRATRRFKADLSLWLESIAWCKSIGARKALGVITGKALQYHPRTPGLWILAADWEFGSNSNVAAARVLFQRGLRLNPGSKQLWQQFFRMELLYVEKLRQRFSVTGLASVLSLAEPGASTSASSDSGIVPRLAEEEEQDEQDKQGGKDADASVQLDDAGVSSEAASASRMQAFLSGTLADTVYRAGVAQLPDDVAFHAWFAAEYAKFPALRARTDAAYAALMQSHPTSPVAWEASARRYEDTDPSQAIDVFQRGLEALDTHTEASQLLLHRFAEFLVRLIRSSRSDHSEYLSLLLSTCKTAVKGNAAAPDTVVLLADTLTRLLRPDDAKAVLQAGCAAVPSSAVLWTRYLQLLACQSSSLDQDVLPAYQQAITALGEDSAVCYPLHVILLDFAIAVQASSKAVACVMASATEQDEALLAVYLTYLFHVDGIAGVRAAYRRHFARRSINSLPLLQRVIALEATQSVRQTRELYQRACDIHGRDSASIWLQWIQWEESTGGFAEASAIYWRACKTLADATSFQEAYQLRH